VVILAVALVLALILLHLGDTLDVTIAMALLTALGAYAVVCGLSWLRR
jgi:hypothetical protein